MGVCCWRHWKHAMIDLNPNHLATVERILAKHVPECEVRTFGSRATWTAKDYSDLDLAVVGEGPLDRRTLGQLKEAFEESSLPMRVDVLDWYAISESFREVIERDYVVLQEGVLEAAVRTEQHTTILGDVTDVVMGQSPPGNTVSSEHGLALLNGPTEFGAHHPTPAQYTTDARKFAQPGDLLFCVRGSTTGRMNWADQEYAIGRGVAAIRHRHEPALQPFVRGVIEVELSKLLTQATGSTFPNVSARQLAEIPYPSLDKSEQRAIAHVLGTLDDKIELNRRMNEMLEAMARALFKSWFVDFEPVQAKLEGRWRRGESLPGFPAEHYDLFPDRLVDSELGEIPEGWEVKALGEVVDVMGGTTPSTKVTEYWEGGTHCWATPRDLSGLSSPVLLDTERKITDAGLDKIGSGLLPPGTLLLSSRAPIGYLAICEEAVAVNQGFIAMPPSKKVSNLFLLHWCSTYHEEIVNHANGSTFLEISKGNFRRIPLVMPGVALMTAFDRSARALYKRIALNERESRALAVQRDALLPGLVSGKVRVGDADKFLKAVKE